MIVFRLNLSIEKLIHCNHRMYTEGSNEFNAIRISLVNISSPSVTVQNTTNITFAVIKQKYIRITHL